MSDHDANAVLSLNPIHVANMVAPESGCTGECFCRRG
jgi:hypothetical protein